MKVYPLNNYQCAIESATIHGCHTATVETNYTIRDTRYSSAP